MRKQLIIQNHSTIDMQHFLDLSHGYTIYILPYLKIVSIICAILVIVSKNPIISILFLIALYANISVYLIIVGAAFIGYSYLLVYIGAISILFIFILMLINVRTSELSTNTNKTIPLVFIVSFAFFYPIYNMLPSDDTKYTFKQMAIKFHNYVVMLTQNTNNNGFNYDDHYIVDSNLWDGNLVETTDITSIGNIMYTVDAMILIITSMILLLAMIGSIIITKKN